MNTKRRIAGLVAILPFLIGALAARCGKTRDPVRESLDRMVRAAHDRDADEVMSLVAEDFRAADGSGRSDAAALLRRQFAAYEILNVTLRDVRIEKGENAARARFRADLAGQPRKLGGLEGLLPTSAAYDFDLRLTRDRGSWKIAWASWSPAEGS